MRISIDVNKHFDWEPLPADAGEPTEADIQALRVKPHHAGGWLMKVCHNRASQTAISIPESQIEDLMAHHVRKGSPKRRGAVVAAYLEDTVMPHHAAVGDFAGIHVEDEPEVEAFLCNYFGVSASTGGSV